MKEIIHITGLTKTYSDGFTALTDINLDIHEGEIFALLGANGAGKTTLIGIICGLVNATRAVRSWSMVMIMQLTIAKPAVSSDSSRRSFTSIHF